jgi:hypothetical protein
MKWYYKIDNVGYTDMIMIVKIIMTTRLFAIVTESESEIGIGIGHYAQSMP